MFSKSLAIVVALALGAASARAGEGWSVLKSGMDQSDTLLALGDPLLKSAARGFEVWLYDGGAEVLCFMGVVVAWTAPAGVESPDGRQVDLRPFFKRPVPAAAAPTASSEVGGALNLAPMRQMRLPKL